MLVVKEKYVNKLLFLFFFSSRRRHTRSKRDWSSDVCSSDLLPFTPRQRSGTSRAVALAKAGVRARVALWWQPCQIGRASCRERVYISVVAAPVKKKVVIFQPSQSILLYTTLHTRTDILHVTA